MISANVYKAYKIDNDSIKIPQSTNKELRVNQIDLLSQQHPLSDAIINRNKKTKKNFFIAHARPLEIF